MAVADEDGVITVIPVALLLALIECAETVAAESEADNESVAIPLFVFVEVAVIAVTVFPVGVADAENDDAVAPIFV
jgi:uncharacterized membrane protein YadS